MSPQSGIGSGLVARSCLSSCIPAGTSTGGGVVGGGSGGGEVAVGPEGLSGDEPGTLGGLFGCLHLTTAAFRLPQAPFFALAGCACRFFAACEAVGRATQRARVPAASSTSP